MSARAKHVIVTYDITSDRRRKRLADFLFEIGLSRVNKSVFEGTLRAERWESIFEDLKPFVRGHDSILIYRVSEAIIHNKQIVRRWQKKNPKTKPRIF